MSQANMSLQAKSKADLSEAKISVEARTPNFILKEFFVEYKPAFRRLVAIREKVCFYFMAVR